MASHLNGLSPVPIRVHEWGPDTPATGKPFSFNGVTFMRVENGKIVSQSDYYDGLGFQKQLGWIQ
jgi:ketosteroid isomerase-like protein